MMLLSLNLELLSFILNVILAAGTFGIPYLESKKPKLLYLQQIDISLNEDIVKKIEGIEIKYNSKLIKNNLHLISGTIFFQSRKDINVDNVVIPLTLEIEDKAGIWKSFNLVENSENTYAKYHNVKNQIIFDKMPLFQDDFFSFTALIDSPTEKVIVLHKTMNVERKVEKVNINSYYNSRTNAILWGLMLITSSLYFHYLVMSESNNMLFLRIREISKKSYLPDHGVEPVYKINEQIVDLNSAFYVQRNKDSLSKINFEKINKKKIESLETVSNTTPSFKNKFYLEQAKVKSLKDAFQDNTIRYEKIYTSGIKLRDSLKRDKNFQLNKNYKLNDSVQVAYQHCSHYHNVPAARYIELLLITLLLGMIYYQTYKNLKNYFRLKPIIRKIGIKN